MDPNKTQIKQTKENKTLDGKKKTKNEDINTIPPKQSNIQINSLSFLQNSVDMKCFKQ